MNDNLILLNFLESILGESDKKSSGNYAFKCPKCNHHKKKLEINLNTNEKGENLWACWTCERFKGKTIKSLLFSIESTGRIGELNQIIVPRYNPYQDKSPSYVKLPAEFLSLTIDPDELDFFGNIAYRQAHRYLKDRNISELDILKYNMGFCIEGKYKNRIVIPSYNQKGILNYFVARDFSGFSIPYLIPNIKKSEIIPYDYYINWDVPVILVEGVFDMLAIKRNSIPLLGKTLGEEILKKIIQYSTYIYVALDNDARKNAIMICEILLSYGKKVYLCDIKDKDFSEMGFIESIKLLQNTESLNFESLIKLKLEII